MGLLSAISDTLGSLSRSAGPPTYYAGSTTIAGPQYLDAFNAKRAPAGSELVEQYKTLIFACAQLNYTGVARTPLRLMADSTKGNGKRPNEASRPRSIVRSYYQHLCRSGYLARTTASRQDVQEITEHPVLWALDNPDPEGYFSRFDLIALMVAYGDVVGVGYLKIDGPDNGPPTYLWPMQSQYVTDIRLPPDPRISYYTYFGRTYQPSELLRFRPPSLSLRDPYARGYSATYAALQYAQLEDKYVAIQDQLLGMGPRPNLLVSAKDATMPMGDAERQRYTQDLNRLHARGMAGGVLVTTGAVDVEPLTYAPTDLAGLTLAQNDLERICNVFGVPVSYFTKDTNLANLQAARTQHAETAIEPRCHAIAGTLTRLVQRYDPRLFFAFDPAVEEDQERDARIVDMGLKNGRITINEANAESPWEPKEWGEEPWLPGTLVQPTMAREKHEQGVAASKAGLDALVNGRKPDETGDSGRADAAADGGGADRGATPGALPALHGGSVDARFDAILASMEKSLGL